MDYAKKVKTTLNVKPDQAALATSIQLNKYILSQFFIQLVNFQQLIKAMNEFVGESKTVKTATLFEGLTLCLNKTMSQMIHDRYDVDSQKKLIKTAMEHIGVKTREVQVKSLFPRLLKLTLIIDKPSASLLSGELKEQLETLFGETLRIRINKIRNRTLKIEVTSARNFKIKHGVAYVGRNAEKLSGDSCMCENFQNGTTILGISDGMGNGEKAKAESSMALRVLKCLLNFDIPVPEAVRVLAELKQESNSDERFFSLDLCLVDKENSKAHFYKQAATTTFILRGVDVYQIEMPGLPIGAVEANGIDELSVDLEENDIIVMCSDGVLDAFEDLELFEHRLIKNGDNDMNKVAQDLLNYAIKRSKGEVNDDMMVVAAQYLSVRK